MMRPMARKDTKNRNALPLEHLMEGLGPAVLKSIRDPFSIISSDFKVLWVNKAMARIHGGKEVEEVLGRTCYEAFNGESSPCLDCPVEAVLATQRTRVMERGATFPDGEKRWGEIRAYPVRGEERDIIAVIVMVIETTSKKRDILRQREYSAYLSKKLSEVIEGDTHIELEGGEITIQVDLSERETEILRLITEGYTNIQISDLFAISPNTVKTHVNNIFNKLGVNDRTQAAVLAIRHRLV